MLKGSRLLWARVETQKSAAISATAVSESSSQSRHGGAKLQEGLQRELYSLQIFMIALSAIIGITIFTTMGEFLHTAGPAGLFVAISLVGLTAISVMESLGELIVQWPVQNAMVRYVEVFIDEDLATVVGLVYWYTYSSVISVMVVSAANLSQYWDFPSSAYIPIFYIVSPLVMIIINWLGVYTFGVFESIAGILKLLFVLTGAFFLIIEGAIRHGSQYEGFHNDPSIALSHASAGIMIIPFLTYGFLGVEIVSVTAFEAKEPRKSLKNSARLIAYVVLLLFILSGVGETLNMSWSAHELPSLIVRDQSGQVNGTTSQHNVRNFSVLVIATNRAGYPRLAGFFNACLIASVLSAANNGLYVASRTLYGLAEENRILPPDAVRWLAKLNGNNVPMWSIVVSGVSWAWLPFQLEKRYSVQTVLPVVITIGSVGTVLVWASQCLVFIFYYIWLRNHKDDLKKLRQTDPQRWTKYDRWMHQNPYKYSKGLSELQPLTAVFGLVSSLLIVFVFSTATWWNHQFTVKKLFVAYGGPIFCGVTWTGLKIARKLLKKQSNPLKLQRDVSRLKEVISNFETALHLRDPDIPLPPIRSATANVLQEDDRNRSPLTPQAQDEDQSQLTGQNQDHTVSQVGANLQDVQVDGHRSQLTLQEGDSPTRH